jgi:hypothetical protein
VKSWVVGLSIVLAACTNQPASTTAGKASPTVAASAAASEGRQPLFAVLEGRRSTSGGDPSFYMVAHDTIALAGFDGFAKAKTTFTPRHIPDVPMAGAVLEPEATPAGGAAYYIDGHGLIRRLNRDGSTHTVTTIPLTSPQQSASFAVSPDGKQFMAGLLTYPTVSPGPNSETPFVESGAWKLDLVAGTDGGSPTVISHQETKITRATGNPMGFHNVQLVGWDAQGPIAVVDNALAVQNQPWDGMRWYEGYLARIKADGSLGQVLGGKDCKAFAPPVHGAVVCAPYGQSRDVSVRTLDGAVLWHGAPTTDRSSSGGFALSPDGSRFAMNGSIVTLAGGSSAPLASNFSPRGWLDRNTIIGVSGSSVAVVRPDRGNALEDWGFSGLFVGLL